MTTPGTVTITISPCGNHVDMYVQAEDLRMHGGQVVHSPGEELGWALLASIRQIKKMSPQELRELQAALFEPQALPIAAGALKVELN